VEHGHADSAFGLLFGAFAFASFLGPLVSAAVGMQTALQVLGLCAMTAGLTVLMATR
jgi:hypothetical protein